MDRIGFGATLDDGAMRDIGARTHVRAMGSTTGLGIPAIAREAPAPAKVELARWLLVARDALGSHVGEDLFADPAFNILLDLYVHHAEGRRVTTSSACIASGVPTTTALRWVNVLVKRGLVVKRDDPSDRRFTFLELSPNGLDRIDSFLAAMRAKLDRLGGA
ncbi:transcriptional regulator [Sphingomonas sp. CJ20]